MANDIYRNVGVAVDTTTTVLSEAKNTNHQQRKVITIINNSSAGQIISIAIEDEAGTTIGGILNVGGHYQESQSEDFLPTNARITAVSSAAGGTVAIMERITVF